jgi:hypothetical protein
MNRTRNGTRGIGIDAWGGSVIDPTKNVEDLVRALEETTEKLRQADARRLDDLRTADNKRIDDLREAEQKKISELAAQKSQYDRQIFDIQTVQVKTTSDLISAQLSKETGSLAGQINASSGQTQGLITTLSARIDRLEQSRAEIYGREQRPDPALAEGIARMGTGISEAMTKMAAIQADATAKLTLQIASIGAMEQTGQGHRQGQTQTTDRVFQIVTLIVAIGAALIASRLWH